MTRDETVRLIAEAEEDAKKFYSNYLSISGLPLDPTICWREEEVRSQVHSAYDLRYTDTDENGRYIIPASHRSTYFVAFASQVADLIAGEV